MTRAWRAWTDEEYGFIESNPTMTNAEIAAALGRQRTSVEQKRRELRLGIARYAGVWTDEEDAAIRETPHMTSAQVAMLLGRSTRSVEHRRSHLGIRAYISKDPFAVGGRPLIAKTCPGCGLFLNAKWFLLEGINRTRRGENWSKYCRKCKWRRTTHRVERITSDDRLARIRANYKARQKVTLDLATRHGAELTDSDHLVLADPDLTNMEKALRTGRSYAAIVAACSKFDYRSRRGLGEIDHDVWLLRFDERCHTFVR